MRYRNFGIADRLKKLFKSHQPVRAKVSNNFSPNALLCLAELFRLAAKNKPVHSEPPLVMVALSVEDCERLAKKLLADSIRDREASESPGAAWRF